MQALQGYKSILAAVAGVVVFGAGALGLLTPEQTEQGLVFVALVFGATFADKIRRLANVIGENVAKLLVAGLGIGLLAAASRVIA